MQVDCTGTCGNQVSEKEVKPFCNVKQLGALPDKAKYSKKIERCGQLIGARPLPTVIRFTHSESMGAILNQIDCPNNIQANILTSTADPLGVRRSSRTLSVLQSARKIRTKA
jgi:hypothetical protein